MIVRHLILQSQKKIWFEMTENKEELTELEFRLEQEELFEAKERPVPKRALLVAVHKGSSEKEEALEHVRELSALADTYGIEELFEDLCSIRKYDASTYVTKGKLEELVEKAKELEVDVIVFDDELPPSQQRNLESAFKIPVMDRTEIILEVFVKHAKTREARLQIELAKCKYQLPRLKRMWTHLSRQRGGGVHTKGEGEKQLEIDRRLLQRRMDRLQKALEAVRAQRSTQRRARDRNEVPTFALVGYTNAGKSSMMNALTEADVLVEDQLFATLDTTTRKYTLPNKQEVLLIDTVGFIRKLPHLLVAAFKSTLEEVVFADFLIHVIDGSHSSAHQQAEATLEVLRELDAANKPMITVINKIDADLTPATVNRLRIQFTRCIQVSAKTGEGIPLLLEVMQNTLADRRQTVNLRIPQSEYGLVTELTRKGHVHEQDYEGDDVLLKVDVPKDILHKVEAFAVKSEENQGNS